MIDHCLVVTSRKKGGISRQLQRNIFFAESCCDDVSNAFHFVTSAADSMCGRSVCAAGGSVAIGGRCCVAARGIYNIGDAEIFPD